MYPTVSNMVVDWKWMGIRKASKEGINNITSLQTITCHIVGIEPFSCLKRNLFPAVCSIGRTCG